VGITSVETFEEDAMKSGQLKLVNILGCGNPGYGAKKGPNRENSEISWGVTTVVRCRGKDRHWGGGE
jgi:hypothetical protein